MNTQLREDLRRCWKFQKLLSLDFTGTSRDELQREFNLTDEHTNAMIMRPLVVEPNHTNHVIAEVALKGDWDGEGDKQWDRITLVATVNELYKEVDTFMEKYPDETIEVKFGYEEYAPNDRGLMDLTGEKEMSRNALIFNGEMIDGRVEVRK